jgi:hypothetical protein
MTHKYSCKGYHKNTVSHSWEVKMEVRDRGEGHKRGTKKLHTGIVCFIFSLSQQES